MGKKLYVGNLSFDMKQADLEQMFSQVGNVEEVAIIMDRETNRSKGFGFVTMASDEEAKKAIAEFDGKECSGRALKVNEARPREDRGGDRGGRSGGRGGFGGGRR
jgi:RNA recognition motif-containing protein